MKIVNDIKLPKKKNKKTSYNPVYWYGTRLFSYDPKKYWFLIAIGSRGRGKTTSAWRWVLKSYLKSGKKFVWLRLTDAPIKKMRGTSSKTLVPSFLLKQLGISGCFLKGTSIFINIERGDEIVTEFVGIMDSISTYYTTKGTTMEDFDNVVFDEINRETTERNTFDITTAFINQIENIARFRRVRVLMLGNTINDTSDILDLFGFHPKPGEFGIYKLTRKHAILEYMDDSKEFKEQREQSLAGVFLKKNDRVATSFTNVAADSMDTVIPYDNRMRQVFIFHTDRLERYGVYTMPENKYEKAGLWVGQVRDENMKSYKISPFLNCEGIYSREIYDDFYELISYNNLYFETTFIRSRFTRALKNNRTIV